MVRPPERFFLRHKTLSASEERLYLRAVIDRYSRPEMRRIWSDERKFQIWLEIEVLVKMSEKEEKK